MWRRVAAPAEDVTGVGDTIRVEGNDIYLVGFGNPAGGAGDAHARFARSTDAGKSWESFADPCGEGPEGENDAVEVSAAPDGVLGVLCLSRSTADAAMFAVVSSDAGRTFGARLALPSPAQAISLGSARNLAVFVWRSTKFLVYVSHDGGRTWKERLSRPGHEGALGPIYLGFQDERTARVTFEGAMIWTTRDAGATWSRSDPF